jgi:light-regulated signal transduction histidine kinase (bacteriophytochrome)
LRSSIAESGATIECQDLPTVVFDASQLVQLFENLIGNAIKYRGSESPRVEVSADRDHDTWVLCVADNGIGIDSTHHEDIFGIFSRLHTKDEYPGTGIGLAICRKIVERHGGRIWVESQPGSGSKFYFTRSVAKTSQ